MGCTSLRRLVGCSKLSHFPFTNNTETNMIRKVLIQEANSRGCSATTEYIGSAMLEIYEVVLGLRVRQGPCGPSPTIDREPKTIKVVKLGDREYVVSKNESPFKEALQAKDDGCDWEVTVNKVDDLHFTPSSPLDPILLEDDYRDN